VLHKELHDDSYYFTELLKNNSLSTSDLSSFDRLKYSSGTAFSENYRSLRTCFCTCFVEPSSNVKFNKQFHFISTNFKLSQARTQTNQPDIDFCSNSNVKTQFGRIVQFSNNIVKTIFLVITYHYGSFFHAFSTFFCFLICEQMRREITLI
jgi:hypothetical protein